MSEEWARVVLRSGRDWEIQASVDVVTDLVVTAIRDQAFFVMGPRGDGRKVTINPVEVECVMGVARRSDG
jgi:hypothetical protein